MQPVNFELPEAIEILSSPQFRMDACHTMLEENDLNAQFLLQYMDMASVLLMFVRAQRDGI